ncbi:MAG: hypothetical protein KGJ79_04635 [Alphaproteobacteria bacterium]|nr:hypothetical protein [Alphaproteobacteria bacterium]MDE2110408.1 hypothetical protein [Alphaproteobacteria bacterium]MDE2493433.1 hypothetical protein [Alphaproteobacteria bacterium]
MKRTPISSSQRRTCRTGRGLHLAAAAILATAGASVTGPAAADNFCRQLKAVVADAPNGFASFRGAFSRTRTEPNIPGFDDIDDTPDIVLDIYVAKGWPDGALSCEIQTEESTPPGKLLYPGYKCEFPIQGTDKGAATRELALRAGNCVGNVNNATVTGLYPNGGMLNFDSKDGTVSYLLSSGTYRESGPPTSTITFTIQYNKR